MSSRATPREPLHREGCLFCRRDDGGFRSREHVFSEAFGNHEYVLKPGIVCDRCNNGPLAVADEALANFPAFTLLRAERGLPTKAGKAVVSKWGNATIEFSGPGQLVVTDPSRKAMRDMPGPDGPMPASGGKMHLTSGGPITEARTRNMVRSVWKATLELIYWDHGAQAAYDAFLDDAREAIIGGDRAQGWAVVPKTSTIGEDIRLEYQPCLVGRRFAIPVRMTIFGVAIYTDLIRRDIPRDEIVPPWPANVWTF